MTDFPFEMRIPVLWGDQDAFGHVNNARYLTWFEAARMRYLAALGVAAGGTPAAGPILARAECDFAAPVHWPTEVCIGARTERVGNTSFEMHYAAWAADDRAVVYARGVAVLVMLDYRTGDRLPISDEFRAALLRGP